MIRIFVLVGIVGGLAIAYLAIFELSPVSQLPPSESLLTGFRAQGVIPASIDLKENETVEHDVFEVPPEDEVELRKVMASMGGMQMAADSQTTMEAEGDNAMITDGDGAMEMDEHEGDDGGVEGGLKITDEGSFDREIELKMTEWGFSEMNIEVKKGERVRFNVANDGEILHEFMVMEMSAMQAINYRALRADWSLLEHEALFEKSLVLPDGKFSFVLEVKEDGAWMFMCMLPYHMQMGMMGQLATAGRATEMQM